MSDSGQPSQDRSRSSAAGFDHHLVKPVGTAVLAALLRTVSEAAGQ